MHYISRVRKPINLSGVNGRTKRKKEKEIKERYLFKSSPYKHGARVTRLLGYTLCAVIRVLLIYIIEYRFPRAPYYTTRCTALCRYVKHVRARAIRARGAHQSDTGHIPPSVYCWTSYACIFGGISRRRHRVSAVSAVETDFGLRYWRPVVVVRSPTNWRQERGCRVSHLILNCFRRPTCLLFVVGICF